MARVHKIGEPENRSESRAIMTLADCLPDNYRIFHNFELTTGRGLPYEYDIVVVGDYAIWHVEVKGYGGPIRGDRHNWILANGFVQPSPIPLANRKTRVLAGKLKSIPRIGKKLFVDTIILLTDSRARVRLRDEQKKRVIRLDEAADRLTDRSRLPGRTANLMPHHGEIFDSLHGGTQPGKPIRQIGLYDIEERINQTDTRTVFLARHRYINTRPQTILKVFHFDVYASQGDRDRQIRAIFHDQDVMRVLGAHPNLIHTGDMFAWDGDKFVQPTEHIEHGRPLATLLEDEEEPEIPWARKSDWIRKMARGLRHAHSHGVIHRDIQPLNVVVDPTGVCKIVNFDLALIQSSPRLGEVRRARLRERLHRQYVAPEVWADPSTACERSDIYSLGIVFQELITGKCPYEDVVDVLEGRANTVDRERLHEALGHCQSCDAIAATDDVVDVIVRMTDPDPAKRHVSMDEVVEDLAIIEA